MSLTILTCAAHAPPKPRPRTLWRLRTATRLTFADVPEIRDELQHISIADERWGLAREGHAAEAISMMIAEWPISSISSHVDILMTAVVFAALTGSAAAALVAYHTAVQLAAHHPELRAIARSWFDVVEERERRRFSRQVAPCIHQRQERDAGLIQSGRSCR